MSLPAVRKKAGLQRLRLSPCLAATWHAIRVSPAAGDIFDVPTPSHNRIIACVYGAFCHAMFVLGVGAMIVAITFGMSRRWGTLPSPWDKIANGFLLIQFPVIHSLSSLGSWPTVAGTFGAAEPRQSAVDDVLCCYRFLAGGPPLRALDAKRNYLVAGGRAMARRDRLALHVGVDATAKVHRRCRPAAPGWLAGLVRGGART